MNLIKATFHSIFTCCIKGHKPRDEVTDYLYDEREKNKPEKLRTICVRCGSAILVYKFDEYWYTVIEDV